MLGRWLPNIQLPLNKVAEVVKDVKDLEITAIKRQKDPDFLQHEELM